MSGDIKAFLAALGTVVLIVVAILLLAYFSGGIILPGRDDLPTNRTVTAQAAYYSTSSASATQTATINAPYTIEANGIRIERFTDKENGNSIYVCRQIKTSKPSTDPVVPCQFQTNPGD
jgi:hypothetical protein